MRGSFRRRGLCSERGCSGLKKAANGAKCLNAGCNEVDQFNGMQVGGQRGLAKCYDISHFHTTGVVERNNVLL